ncbi:ADYC domain-containing protein [Nannocystis bainbridge]|uniref:ADYC domain-containing protein n=1 Tax=Nannocystis bainbridge TaxID=2995303 RepID=A0ABT5E6V3_9BACT|nr:ADYC domain-containing protein [Nannocystis bainbridge]MDC0720496.1 ADYC domain-containing protein [Nannocystis bainbridge]
MIGFRLAPLALIGLSAVGCTEVPSEDDLEFRTTCTACTFNSPHIDNAPMPELALDGEENSAGVKLIALRDTQTTVDYEVGTDSQEDLVARDGNLKVAIGPALYGWELVLEKDGVEKIATITGHGEIEAWSDNGRPMPTYAISYHGLVDGAWGHWNVCPEFVGSPESPVLTIIRGQTYDREDKRVDLIDSDWVTFACVGEAAFKAKALGYSQGRRFAGTNAPATRGQQDATLKMITADYCGTGHSFTAPNTALHWENRAGTVTIPMGTVTGPLEAVWGPDGALCLDNPRHTTKALVEAECGYPIPSCAGFDYTGPWEWKTFKKL